MFFAAGYIAEKTFEGLVIRTTQKKLENLKQKLGIAIVWTGIDAGLGGVEVSDLAIGNSQDIIIDRILVQIDFNPLSPSFLRPGQIKIGRIYVKAAINLEQRIDWLKELWTKYRSTSGNGKVRTADSSLPSVIQIEAATIILADGNREHTRLMGLQGTAYPLERRIKWRSKEVVWAPYISEKNLDGSLNLVDDHTVKALLKARTKESGSADWTLRCDYEKILVRATCEIDAKVIPQSLIARLQPHLGTSFAPGVQGTVVIQKSKAGSWQGTFDGDINGIVVEHKSLSIDAVGPFDAGARFSFDANLSQRSFKSDDMKIGLPVKSLGQRAVALDVDINISKQKLDQTSFLKGQIRVGLPVTDCDDVLKVVPKGLSPDLAGFQLGGKMAASVYLSLDFERTDLTWGKTEMNCFAKNMPEMYSAAYLNGPFVLERTFGKNEVIHIPVDPSDARYTALSQIPQRVVTTFVTSEDAGFWQHKGIEPAAIEQALERNAREGRAVVGGSTITMQTVKNLFLSRDKTLSRKAQEVFLAWHLERVIGKKRVLEIYFNIVEFGPDLYGIGDAAHRFFGVKPDELNAKQAAYLASLLPAPVPRYQYFCRGSLTENYRKLVDGILQRLLALGRISGTEYNAAFSQNLRFLPADQDAACLARRTVAGAKQTADEDANEVQAGRD